MTPEQVLGALVARSMSLDFGTPDPLVMEAKAGKIGKARPVNWRLLPGNTDDDPHIELLPATPSALGKQTRAASKYSMSEVAADAIIGMYERNWHTLQCAIGVGSAVRPLVVNRLTAIAYRIKNSERVWRDTVRRQPCECGRYPLPDYVPDLVELAVRHLEDPFSYHTHRTRALWIGLSESHWHAVMSRPFDQVAAHIWSWYYAGIGHIQNRIRQRGHRLE